MNKITGRNTTYAVGRRLLSTQRAGILLLLSAAAILCAVDSIYGPLRVATLAAGLLAGISLSRIALFATLRRLLPERKNPTIEDVLLSLKASKEFVERYQVLMDNLAAAVIIRNPQGKITYCSPYTEVLTGYSLDEIYSSPNDFWSEIMHDADRERHERAAKITAAGEAFHFRHRFYHKSGIEMWGEVRSVPVLNSEGRILFSLSVVLDVTGMVRYQRQVEEKNKDLQDFTYMVSHDLKAPLVTTKGMLGVLNEDLGPALTPDIKETLAHMNHAVSKMDQLVMSVLEYSKVSIQESKLSAISLHEVIDDALTDFEPQIKALAARVTIEPDLPEVMGEKIKLYQIFSNLIGNALKYHDPARPLMLSIREQPGHSKRLAVILVSDNGIGIPPDKHDAVFRPFQRAHPGRAEGLGIGLASVKKLLERCGGHIELKSEVGKGSTFILTLKRAIDPNTLD